ncbi:MAG: hypothetical protein SGI92_32945 [Bryobacteraceae bacterium]|nr:hypothetical protein [Bryobacteraceae bacterium]
MRIWLALIFTPALPAFRTGILSKVTRAPDPPRPLVERPKGTETEALTPRGRVPIPPPAQRVDLLGVLGELFRLGIYALVTGPLTWSNWPSRSRLIRLPQHFVDSQLHTGPAESEVLGAWALFDPEPLALI